MWIHYFKNGVKSKFVLWQPGYYNLLIETYFSGRPNKVKEKFELFLIDPYAGDIENKNIAGKCYKILESVSPILY